MNQLLFVKALRCFQEGPRSLRGACLPEDFVKPAKRHREPFVETTHARKDQKRRLGGFTVPPQRFGEELSWDSNTMMLVIVLSRYHHTVDPMLLTMGNPFESHKDVFVRAVNVPT